MYSNSGILLADGYGRLAAAAVLLSSMLLAASGATADDKTPSRTVAVDGEGIVAAPPDMATVVAGVISEAETAAAAVAANSEAMNTLMQALREHGIAERDIATTGFSVDPRYQQPEIRTEPIRIIGYSVSNQVSVRTRKLDTLGRLLDLVVNRGGNRIANVQFDIEDDADLMDQARREAFADARGRAGLYAREAGARLGRLRTVSESSVRPLARGGFEMRAMAMDSSVPVAGGERELQVTVHAVFDLEYEDD